MTVAPTAARPAALTAAHPAAYTAASAAAHIAFLHTTRGFSLAALERRCRRSLSCESIVTLEVTENKEYICRYIWDCHLNMFYAVHINRMDVLIGAAYPLNKVWGRGSRRMQKFFILDD